MPLPLAPPASSPAVAGRLVDSLGRRILPPSAARRLAETGATSGCCYSQAFKCSDGSATSYYALTSAVGGGPIYVVGSPSVCVTFRAHGPCVPTSGTIVTPTVYSGDCPSCRAIYPDPIPPGVPAAPCTCDLTIQPSSITLSFTIVKKQSGVPICGPMGCEVVFQWNPPVNPMMPCSTETLSTGCCDAIARIEGGGRVLGGAPGDCPWRIFWTFGGTSSASDKGTGLTPLGGYSNASAALGAPTNFTWDITNVIVS